LSNATGKKILKQAAVPYLDHDLIYRRKQGFGAPMAEWFREGDFGPRCLAAFQRSPLRRQGFIDGAYFSGLLQDQIAGRTEASFRLWTVMNAILWHASWVEGRPDCF
jgi:asparagine synthase (glutamine-hydrolysing)